MSRVSYLLSLKHKRLNKAEFILTRCESKCTNNFDHSLDPKAVASHEVEVYQTFRLIEQVYETTARPAVLRTFSNAKY